MDKYCNTDLFKKAVECTEEGGRTLWWISWNVLQWERTREATWAQVCKGAREKEGHLYLEMLHEKENNSGILIFTHFWKKGKTQNISVHANILIDTLVCRETTAGVKRATFWWLGDCSASWATPAPQLLWPSVLRLVPLTLWHKAFETKCKNPRLSSSLSSRSSSWMSQAKLEETKRRDTQETL